MPSASDLIEVRASPDAALDTAHAALSQLGWLVRDDPDGPDRLRAIEDPAPLNCRTSPSRIRVRVEAGPAGGSVLTLDADAPGIGPIPGPARLRRQIAVLESRIVSLSGAEDAE